MQSHACSQDINQGSWRATNKFINVLGKGNIYKVIKSTIIEAGLKYGLATGNWGVKTSRVRQGVAQASTVSSPLHTPIQLIIPRGGVEGPHAPVFD